MSDNRSYALVLGGGGTKGVYQIGAWRAFRELGLTFNAVAGASVGALNAGLIAQDSYELGLEIWNDITLDDIVKLPPDLLERQETEGNHDGLPSFSELRRYMMRNHGLDAQPLRELLHENIDEAKIRRSGIDLGITTYELTNLRQVEVFLEDIPSGQLADYLLASASFPAFRSTEIQGRRFTDGGIVDNIPYRMIKDRGHRRIIIVDVSGLGINRRPQIEGTDTVYLKNSIEMGSILDFDPEFISSFMELGYLDALRLFGGLTGIHYYLDEGAKGRAILRELEELLFSREVMASCRSLLVPQIDSERPDPDPRTPTNELQAVRSTLPRDMRNYREIIIALAECAALSLDLERVQRYTIEEFIHTIWEQARALEAGDLSEARHLGYRSILDLIKRKWALVNHRVTDERVVPLLYDLAFEGSEETPRRAIYLRGLRRLYPALTPARIFFQVLDRYFKRS